MINLADQGDQRQRRGTRRNEISLIIPAHNEEARLAASMCSYVKAFEARLGERFEVIVVANACTDRTVAIAHELATRYPQVRVLNIAAAVGKGGAVLAGFEIADSDRLVFADADAATSAESLLELVDGLSSHDLVIGSRRLPDSVILQTQPPTRRLLGSLFAYTVRRLFGLPYQDTQCGAKALRAESARALARVVRERSWTFDLDLLLCARAAQMNVLEHPVVWADQPGSQLRVGSTLRAVAAGLWRLKRRARRGPKLDESTPTGSIERLHELAASRLASILPPLLVSLFVLWLMISEVPSILAEPRKQKSRLQVLDRRRRLGERLLDAGVVSAHQLETALAVHHTAGVRTGEALVSLGFTSESQVAQTLATQHGVPYVELDTRLVDPALAASLGYQLAWDMQILPLRRMNPGSPLQVACADLPNPDDIEQVRHAFGSPVEPVLVTPTGLHSALHDVFRQEYVDVSGNHLAELQPENSAKRVLSRGQQVFFSAVLVGVVTSFVANALVAGTVLAVAITLFYALCSAYKLYLTCLAFGQKREVEVHAHELNALSDRELPVYTVLVPLYRETEVLPTLIDAITRLDYPKAKLDVRLLLEEDDVETRAAVRASHLPGYFTAVVVPKGKPRGKPRACNYGLIHARGEFIVIYDAEDLPEPDQLKKAIVAFRKGESRLACVQAKLNYFNRDQNSLTRWFTTEYNMWFDLLLPGLGVSGAPIPLGGTSNHFRADQLRSLGAWDPYNVTEDADLGIRLHKSGWKTVVVDSTTYEEANSQVFNWILQRSRWIKGYIQTYLVHMRNPVQLWRAVGWDGFVSFQLMVGGTVASLLLNPILWALTAVWFITRVEYIQAIFPTPILYLGTLALFFGNFAFVYLTVAGCLQRRHYHLVPFALLTPIYWALMSIAAWKGFVQLFYAPSYWEKTRHGLYRGKIVHSSDDGVHA